ncbi:MAG: hypothetical protein H0V16_08970 [Burkholderiaceae bacterium]|nr:hypothetical protein [Burkholderiaceae bacterium]
MIKTILAVLSTAILMAASSTALANTNQAAVGVSIRIVDSCGVVQMSGNVQIRCRSDQASAAKSGLTRISPASTTQQWCSTGAESNSDAAKPTCVAKRAAGYELQLVTMTF